LEVGESGCATLLCAHTSKDDTSSRVAGTRDFPCSGVRNGVGTEISGSVVQRQFEGITPDYAKIMDPQKELAFETGAEGLINHINSP
jgi:hypothetical protein